MSSYSKLMKISQIVIHIEIDFKNKVMSNNQKNIHYYSLTEREEAFQFLNLLHESENQIP
jgi:hypothetical protein